MPRPRLQSRQSRAATKRVDWSATFAELFRLADGDWTPPTKVSIRQGARNATFTGTFLMANGHPCKLSVKIDLAQHQVIDETMSVAYRLKGQPG